MVGLKKTIKSNLFVNLFIRINGKVRYKGISIDSKIPSVVLEMEIEKCVHSTSKY